MLKWSSNMHHSDHSDLPRKLLFVIIYLRWLLCQLQNLLRFRNLCPMRFKLLPGSKFVELLTLPQQLPNL